MARAARSRRRRINLEALAVKPFGGPSGWGVGGTRRKTAVGVAAGEEDGCDKFEGRRGDGARASGWCGVSGAATAVVARARVHREEDDGGGRTR